MPELIKELSRGVLRPGWTSAVGDYAIAGAWTGGGELFVVGDAAGGVYAFGGTSGDAAWSHAGAHQGGMLAMSIHPDGKLIATAGQDGRILLWNTSAGEIIRAIDVSNDWVEHIAWSPTGNWLAASSARQTLVYDLEGNEVWRSDDHPSTVSALAWASEEELATACYGRVSFFRLPAGEVRQQLEWKGSLVSMALSPDGDIVACGSQDNSVHFWRRSTSQDSMMSGYPGKPSGLAFDHTGTVLATSGSKAVTVWSFQGDGPEGTTPGVLELHVQPITALSFAARGMRLASGGRDAAVVVWSLKPDGQGEPVGAAVVADVVDSLYWRPDGRALAALDAQGAVTVWRVSA